MYQTPLCSPVHVYQTTLLGTLDSDPINTELGKVGLKSNPHINKYFSKKKGSATLKNHEYLLVKK